MVQLNQEVTIYQLRVALLRTSPHVCVAFSFHRTPPSQMQELPVSAAHPFYKRLNRLQGVHGKRWMRRRGEYIEWSFAHMYETGAMRRTHLRGRENIRKRLLIHAVHSI